MHINLNNIFKSLHFDCNYFIARQGNFVYVSYIFSSDLFFLDCCYMNCVTSCLAILLFEKQLVYYNNVVAVKIYSINFCWKLDKHVLDPSLFKMSCLKRNLKFPGKKIITGMVQHLFRFHSKLR